MRLVTIADVEAAMAKPPTDDLVARMERRREREAHAEQRRIDAAEMVRVVADGIRLLNAPMMGERGIPSEDIEERGRNITQALLGIFSFSRLP